VLELARYTYRLAWSDEDQQYVGICLEFPSLRSLDSTPAAALEGIRLLVTQALANQQAGNEPLAHEEQP
jgi:hypothetical protein